MGAEGIDVVIYPLSGQLRSAVSRRDLRAVAVLREPPYGRPDTDGRRPVEAKAVRTAPWRS